MRDLGLNEPIGGQDSVDSIISLVLLSMLVFNTNFDLYKRTVVIVTVKIVSVLIEYLIVAVLSGLFASSI